MLGKPSQIQKQADSLSLGIWPTVNKEGGELNLTGQSTGSEQDHHTSRAARTVLWGTKCQTTQTLDRLYSLIAPLERERRFMRAEQSVGDMAEELLARQAMTLAQRSGEPLIEALEDILKTPDGSPVEPMDRGPDWQPLP
jgi:hypothetical protein